MVTRREFVKTIGLLPAVAMIPEFGALTPRLAWYIFTAPHLGSVWKRYSLAQAVSAMSDCCYSLVWTETAVIEREFTTPHKSCWVMSLEYTLNGQNWWGCYECIDDLKRVPKAKAAFFGAMYRGSFAV